MRIPLFLFSFLTISFLMLSSCSSTLKIERPDENNYEPVITSPQSDITIPFSFEISRIEKLINREFSGVIYDDNSYENNGRDDLMIKATKAGDFNIFMEGNEFTYRVPLDLWVKKRINIGVMGYSYTDEREITGAIALKFRTRLTLGKDWKIITHTTSEGYDWLKKPSVKVGPVSFPLGFIADMLISANQKTINSEIDKSFSSAFDIKNMLTGLWKDIQVPFRIEGDYPLWAKITPSQIRMVSPVAANGQLNLAFGIRATTEIYYNESAPQYVMNSHLPEALVISRLDDGVSINLMADIPYTHLNEMASKQLKGYSVKQGKYTLTVENIFIYGNGDKLVVAADVSGSVKGTIYLTGKPYFDKSTSSFKVADLDFDLKTKNVLLKSAGWIFHNGLLQSVEQKLEFPAGEQLADIRKQLGEMLSQNSKIDIFRISGSINKVDIGRIYITRSGVKGLFEFEGKIKVGLD